MGTSGLVGILESYITMDKIGRGGVKTIFLIITLYILLPGVVTYLISIFLRKREFIKDGDMKIEN